MCKTCGVELHVHSEISWDAICSPTELVHRAHALGQNAIAFTEHFECNSIVEASVAGRKLGVKTIAGCEVYLDIGESFTTPNITHLTILGNGVKGYNDIIKIQKAGVMRTVKGTTLKRFYKRPPIYQKDIFDNSSNLIVLSGCPSSAFNDIRKFDDGQIDGFYKEFKQKLGDRFYVEIMLSAEDIGGLTAEQRIRNSLMYARKYNLRFVVTSDVHYAEKHQHAAHDFFKKSQHSMDYDSSKLYMRNATETMALMQGLDLTDAEKELLVEGILEQQKIADRLENTSFNTGIIMPELENGKQKFEDVVAIEYQRHLSIVDYADDEYIIESKARLDEELKVIRQMGFETYFQLIYEIHKFVYDSGGKLPFGRGSAGGSFVCYLMGIVQLNPLLYGFLFERFLNIMRESAIDIDADFSSYYRNLAINEFKKRYNIIPIVTHIRYGHDSLINDLASSKKFYMPPKDKAIVKNDEAEFRNTEVWKKLEAKSPEINIIYDTLLGGIRGKSRHAAGFVLPQKDSKYEIPLTMDSHGNILCALVEGMSAAEASELGLNKIDLLVIDGLTFLEALEKATGATAPTWLYDEYDESFQLLETGQTEGIFQYMGAAIRDYAMLHGIKSFRDIMDVTAYARKGVMIAKAHTKLLHHRPVNGLPLRRSNGVKDNGQLLEVEMENGVKFKIYSNWEIHTENRGWIIFDDVLEDDELTIEGA